MTTPRLAPTTPKDLVQFFERWDSLPKTGLMPRLRDYLDTAPPQLQPNVVIVDVHADGTMIVRLFGTGLESASGLLPTTHNLMTLYGASVRNMAHRLVLTTVSHPVGYVCTRKVVTTKGAVVECPAIGLPVGVDDAHLKCFITYANIAGARASLSPRDSLELVQDITFHQWIDLGAGVPEAPEK